MIRPTTAFEAENEIDVLHKKAIGELWAARSDGRARFAWVVEKDWAALEERLVG